MVKIPDPETTNPKTAEKWTRVTDPVHVEMKILERNHRHFGQASIAPLASADIQSLLSFDKTSYIADQLPYKQLDPSSITPGYYGQQLVAKCSTEITELCPDITFDDMKQKYRCWPERTSSSPSGCHLSHYRALLKTGGLLPNDDDFDEIDSARRAVWSVHHSMLQYLLRHGYCFNRWNQVVNAMIVKKAGDPRIHRLRVIHLYEADYSLIFGIQF
jgi:hypothetical protein